MLAALLRLLTALLKASSAAPVVLPPATPEAPVAPPKAAPEAAPEDHFQDCLKFVWQFDGLQDDRAPTENFATAYGVTEYTWSEAIRREVVANKPISEATKDNCSAVLRRMFYNACGCDKMLPGVDLIVFNNAMVCGVGNASKTVQRVVGTKQDGVVGPATLAAVNATAPKLFIDTMVKADLEHFASLANAPTYLNGWTRRENEAQALAYTMAGVT